MAQVQFADRLLKEAPMGHWAIGPVNGIPGIWIFQISGFVGLYGYPIAGYGDVCMPDDSDKAWGYAI